MGTPILIGVNCSLLLSTVSLAVAELFVDKLKNVGMEVIS